MQYNVWSYMKYKKIQHKLFISQHIATTSKTFLRKPIMLTYCLMIFQRNLSWKTRIQFKVFMALNCHQMWFWEENLCCNLCKDMTKEVISFSALMCFNYSINTVFYLILLWKQLNRSAFSALRSTSRLDNSKIGHNSCSLWFVGYFLELLMLFNRYCIKLHSKALTF